MYVTAGTTLVAIDIEAGVGAWTATLPAEGVLAPALGDDRVFVATTDGYLVAVDRETGDRSWKQGVGGSPGGPTAANGTVYAGNSDGRLFAFDASTGDVEWSRELDTYFPVDSEPFWRPTPAIDDQYLYVNVSVDNANPSVLFALDPETGSTEWEYSQEGDRIDAPAVNDEYVCITGPTTVTILSKTAGIQQWEYEYDAARRPTMPAALGDEIVAVIDDPTVRGAARCTAFDINTGEPRWDFTYENATAPGGVTIAGDTVYYTAITGSRSAEVFGLGKADGLKQFQHSAANSPIDFGPIPLENALLIPLGTKVACLGDGSQISGDDGGNSESNDVPLETEDTGGGTGSGGSAVETDGDSGGLGVFEVISTIITLIATLVGIFQLKS